MLPLFSLRLPCSILSPQHFTHYKKDEALIWVLRFYFGHAPCQGCSRSIGSGCPLLLLAAAHTKTPQPLLWGIRFHPSRRTLRSEVGKVS